MFHAAKAAVCPATWDELRPPPETTSGDRLLTRESGCFFLLVVTGVVRVADTAEDATERGVTTGDCWNDSSSGVPSGIDAIMASARNCKVETTVFVKYRYENNATKIMYKARKEYTEKCMTSGVLVTNSPEFRTFGPELPVIVEKN